MNYGVEVWGFCKAVHIERIHLQFCKMLLSVKISLQNNFIYGELGRTSCQIQRYLIIVRFWLKIVNTNANKYIRFIYDMMLRDLEVSNRNINWVSLVKHLLCNNSGFREVWLQQNVGDIKVFLSMFKQRLKIFSSRILLQRLKGHHAHCVIGIYSVLISSHI